MRLNCGDQVLIAVSQRAIVQADGWLRIRETGVDVGWGHPVREISGRPPRLSEVSRAVSAGDETPIVGKSGLAIVELHCGTHSPYLQCWNQVRTAADAANGRELERLTAEHGTCGALAEHELAFLVARSGEHVRAHAIYARLVTRWQQLGELDRAAAAALGQTEQSANAGNFLQARDESFVAERMNLAVGLDAFARRARVTRATALANSGQRAAAKRVTLALISEYEQIGECNEAVNLGINAAQIANLEGDIVGLDSWIDRLASADHCQLTPVVQNRLALVRARAATIRGEFAQAIRIYSDTVALEANAVQRSQIYRALAELYRQLGMHTEAYSYIARSLREIPSSEAPHRVAWSLMVLASIDHDTGRGESSAQWLRSANQIFTSLGLDDESALSRMWLAQVELLSGGTESARALLDHQSGTRNRVRACLLEAEILRVEGNLAAARTTLASHKCVPLALDDILMHAATLSQSVSIEAEANAATLAAARRIESLVAGAHPALQFAALRRAATLRDAATARPLGRAENLANLILATHPYRQSHGPRSAEAVSPAFGLWLLNDVVSPAAKENSDRAVLKALGQENQGDSTPIEISDVRRSLGEREWMLMISLGDRQSAAIWMSRNELLLSPLPGRSVLVGQVENLHSALLRRQGAELDVAIERLSSTLMSTAPALRERLLILADDRLGLIPWSVLEADGKPLIEKTSISWISSLTVQTSPHPLIDAATAIVASNVGPGASNRLAPLYSAVHETDLLSLSLPRLKLEALTASKATPEALQRALMSSGRLVHVAAHGYSSPQEMGYAGLWLAPDAIGGEPQFMSWMDVATSPLNASLAVLNACQLAAGSTTVSTPSFALAVSTAGVQNVIAAAWPVSDAATNVWVPAFYHALDLNDPSSSAEALRHAQLALRNSRYFRHPYYWASLAHYRQLGIKPP